MIQEAMTNMYAMCARVCQCSAGGCQSMRATHSLCGLSRRSPLAVLHCSGCNCHAAMISSTASPLFHLRTLLWAIGTCALSLSPEAYKLLSFIDCFYQHTFHSTPFHSYFSSGSAGHSIGRQRHTHTACRGKARAQEILWRHFCVRRTFGADALAFT